ncbi:VCBS domain-containing protein [Aeromonas salmonicida]|uniref:VCBS domain-containing protein n=1 Tax=Aeromonas salmonicida TaxID=645 RepID=UPI00145A0D5C|nr:VCBS domain-containing protein [Aeromonas salmonicida]
MLGQYGEFTLAANGVWSFTANSAFNELNVGDQLSESFAVTSVDGTPSSVTVTITGSNDAAVVSSANVTLTETDAPLVTGGTLTATDVDNPDNTFTPITVLGQYGEFTLAANGVWSFTANSAFNELNVGDQLSESFAVTSVDGTPSSVTVTITGSNDAAVVSSANVTLTETDAPLVTGGTLTATDVDNPDNTFTPITVVGQYGEFTLAANGVWSFTANSAFNELNVGDQLSESFAVTSVDGTPSSVTVTITGSNDAAVVSSANVTLTETDAPLVTGGTLTATDVDNPDNTFTPITVLGQYGEFTLAANGVWSFTANSAFNELNVGDQLSESFAVTSVDGTPSSVTVTITGSNDAAVVSSANVTLTETDAPLVTGGTLTATDVDNPDNTFPDHRGGPVRRVHPGGQRRVELHRQQRVQRTERG